MVGGSNDEQLFLAAARRPEGTSGGTGQGNPPSAPRPDDELVKEDSRL